MYAAVNYRVNPEISVPNILWHTGKSVVAAVRFITSVFVWLFTAASESRQQVAMLAGIIGATLIVVSVWQIALGMTVIAALTMVAKRKGKI